MKAFGLIALLTLANAASASAAVVTVNFSGTATVADVGTPLGSAFSGWLKYDTLGPTTLFPGDPAGAIYQPLLGLSIAFEGASWS